MQTRSRVWIDGCEFQPTHHGASSRSEWIGQAASPDLTQESCKCLGTEGEEHCLKTPICWRSFIQLPPWKVFWNALKKSKSKKMPKSAPQSCLACQVATALIALAEIISLFYVTCLRHSTHLLIKLQRGRRASLCMWSSSCSPAIQYFARVSQSPSLWHSMHWENPLWVERKLSSDKNCFHARANKQKRTHVK